MEGSGLCKTGVRPSRSDAGQTVDWLSVGQKSADQSWELIESLWGLKWGAGRGDWMKFI